MRRGCEFLIFYFLAEGVVVAEVFEVGGAGFGFELGGVEQGVVALHHAVECGVGGALVGGFCGFWRGVPAKFAVERFHHHGGAAEFAFGGIARNVGRGNDGFME